MAEKELRKMNRTELIEIIYALQQNEKTLQKEKTVLQRRLNDKYIRLEKAGSIAEAALSLNHIFEDAQKASEQYLATLETASAQAEKEAEKILEAARKQAKEILDDAKIQQQKTQEECEQLLRQAKQEAEKTVGISVQEGTALSEEQQQK